MVELANCPVVELADCRARLERLQISFGLQKVPHQEFQTDIEFWSLWVLVRGENRWVLVRGENRWVLVRETRWGCFGIAAASQISTPLVCCIPSDYFPDRSSEASGKLDNLRLLENFFVELSKLFVELWKQARKAQKMRLLRWHLQFFGQYNLTHPLPVESIV